MKRKNFHVRTICGMLTVSLLTAAAFVFQGCTDEAGDCHNTLSCPLPAYCAEAGDARLDGCFFDPDGASNAQGD
jgi:hypothetical protein